MRAQAAGDTRAEALHHLDLAIAELRDMHMQPALERALELLDRSKALSASPVTAPPAYPDHLSEREVEVLRLLAAGRSNLEIAAELVISLNTVARHANHIFAKIGATNRVEAATYAHRQGLAWRRAEGPSLRHLLRQPAGPSDNKVLLFSPRAAPLGAAFSFAEDPRVMRWQAHRWKRNSACRQERQAAAHSQFTKRYLAAAAGAALMVAAVAGIGARQIASHSSTARTGSVAGVVAPAAANATSPFTYYLVSSQEQADALDANLKSAQADFEARSGRDFQYSVAVVSSPRQEQLFREAVSDSDYDAAAFGTPHPLVVDMRPSASSPAAP